MNTATQYQPSEPEKHGLTTLEGRRRAMNAKLGKVIFQAMKDANRERS